MRLCTRVGYLSVVSAVLAAPVFAQDSVSNATTCLPGDAVAPWDDSSATNGSEQSNEFVVDLVSLIGSWGTEFGIAPMLKSSKTSSGFFNSLLSAQAISRTQQTGVDVSGISYGEWSTAGEGVNNDFTKNDPPATVSGPSDSNQFAAAFLEFGTTDQAATYEGVITGLVNYDQTDASRMYVRRVVSAITGCDDGSQYSDLGFGHVDNNGIVSFRSDSFGIGATVTTCTGATNVSNQNLYLVNSSTRNAASLNIINGSFPTLFDATTWVLQASTTTHGVPNIGDIQGIPFVLGANFNAEYVRGPASPPINSTAHLAAASTGARGNLSRLEQNHAAFPLATDGLAAIIGNDAAGNSTIMNVWGLDVNGAPVNPLALQLPLAGGGLITDACTGNTNLVPAPPDVNQLDHYHSQVAFSGNAQIAMNVDAVGNLLVAAVVDQPLDGGANWNFHYIAVAKVTPAGAVSWTMAAYNTSSGGAQSILDGPSGTVIGALSDLGTVTGGIVLGPSFSAPMIDSAGNVWFVSAIDLTASGGPLTSGLIRAVYDRVNFCYELELIVKDGDIFTSANTGLDYLVDVGVIADSNSVSSSTAWVQNISEQGHLGQEWPIVANSSPAHLGGLILNCEIVYDRDGDGSFDPNCTGTGTSDEDENYEMAVYIGALKDYKCQPDLGFQGPGGLTASFCGIGLDDGCSSTYTLTGGPAFSGGVMLWSAPGGVNIPILDGTLVSFTNYLSIQVPFALDNTGSWSLPLIGVSSVFDVVLQSVALDGTLPNLLTFSNALTGEWGR